MARKKAQSKTVDGWLLAWVAITIFIVITTLITNYNNLIGWGLNLIFIIDLIMVFTCKGSRWFIAITSAIIGGLIFFSAMNIMINPLSSMGYGLRGGLSMAIPADEAIRLAHNTAITMIFFSIYLFASGLYFALSKKIKARFAK